jgi:type IV pilus assembly protein PilM
MHNSIGVYFGIKNISLVETKDKKIVRTITVPYETISAENLDVKVPEEEKLAIAIESGLKNGGITAKDVAITLSGNDLIIRSFEMNLLPRNELSSAVNFEAKKYIPFKTEDLISDFQLKTDRKTRKNLVLFFSIKNETLEKYLSVIRHLEWNIINNNIEYSAFSLLRLLSIAGIKKQGVFGVLCLDAGEETNFAVLEEDFPLFSRDINLSSGFEVESMPAQDSLSPLLWDKLKNEIRISLDYYRRKFPTKQITRLIVIVNQALKKDIEALGSELSMPVEFVDISKYAGIESSAISISLIKAYSVSLAGSIKTPLKVNLLSVKEKASQAEDSEAELESAIVPTSIRIDYRFLAAGVFIILLTLTMVTLHKMSLNKELSKIIKERPQLTILRGENTYEQLEGVYADYTFKLNTLEDIARKNVYLTEQLNVIPSVLPSGGWLEKLSFSQGSTSVELTLEGEVFLGDRNKEFEQVNEIYSRLKSASAFAKKFQEINIASLRRTRVRDWEVTSFTIFCKGKK